MTIEAAIAANRFGIGARGKENVPDRPKKWLLDQLDQYQAKPAGIAALPDRAALADIYLSYQMEKRADKKERDKAPEVPETPASNMPADRRKKGNGEVNQGRKEIRDLYDDAVRARLNTALTSDTGFAERLAHFWSNHFAISVNKPPVRALAGNYEFDAIRPNIMGKFSDLLFASVRHPCMLIYLDQAQSIGPNTMLAQRVAARTDKKRGLNENLAREIMELHTLGVRTGYSQADVTELARALTGLSVAGIGAGARNRNTQQSTDPGSTLFNEAQHEPGTRTVMGKSYPQAGAGQATAILQDLAVHPATAKHIATKLARHFVADTPPPALVSRLEQGFLKTGGDLPTLYRILVESPEAWVPAQAKFKTPWEWVVSSLRALNMSSVPGNAPARAIFAQLGQPVWEPGSPAGFSDMAEDWAGGAGLMRRVELASRFAQRSANQVDARALGPKILSGVWSEHSAQWISRAESPEQGLALFLVAPEFLRR
jgi:uncharacterized protein (DUF1800 family)